MPHPQRLFLLTVVLSLKSSVSAIPIPTHNGGGLIGGLVDDVLGVPIYATRNDQNQKQTIFVTQYVTTPMSLAEPTSQEHPTTVSPVTSTVTSFVQAAAESSATATAASSTATPELVPEAANPTTTRTHQAEPTNDTHNSSMRRIKGPIVAGYYPDWASSSLAPEQVDWKTFDWVDFAFGIPDANFDLVFTRPDSQDLLRRLSSAAHGRQKKVKLSIGGWTGSAHFSRAVATREARDKFSSAITGAYNEYQLDGIDLDWEYCGVEAYAGNAVTPEDCDNFLKFLHVLRNKLPTQAVITAATRVVPFAGSDGRPMTDVSAFSKVLDWVMIMNYDTVGSSATPGPNAPLWDKCGTSGRPESSARAAIEAWKAAGFPAEQLVLGLPSYGYIQRSTVDRLQNRRAMHPNAGLTRRRRRAALKGVAPILVTNGDGGSEDGQVHFSALVRQGALVKGGKTRHGVPTFVGGGEFERLWDACSSTPWLRSKLTKQVITYDDPESLWMKGNLAKHYELLGVSLFSIDGDDEDGVLMASVRGGMGLKV